MLTGSKECVKVSNTFTVPLVLVLVLTSCNGSNSTEEDRDTECNGDGCDLHDESENICLMDYATKLCRQKTSSRQMNKQQTPRTRTIRIFLLPSLRPAELCVCLEEKIMFVCGSLFPANKVLLFYTIASSSARRRILEVSTYRVGCDM